MKFLYHKYWIKQQKEAALYKITTQPLIHIPVFSDGRLFVNHITLILPDVFRSLGVVVNFFGTIFQIVYIELAAGIVKYGLEA